MYCVECKVYTGKKINNIIIQDSIIHIMEIAIHDHIIYKSRTSIETELV